MDIDYLHALRMCELAAWLARIHADKNHSLLEIGAGTGAQAARLSRHFSTVAAVDLAASPYAKAREFPVQDYDGRRLPFADASFDVIYTSHVLEHVADFAALSDEMRRVLKPGGIAVHVLPTPAWRIASCFTHYLALPKILLSRAAPQTGATAPGAGKSLTANLLSLLFAARHGENGNRFTEAFYYRSAWWRRRFIDAGWQVTDEFPLGLFYTGYMIFGTRLGVALRGRLANILGSSSYCFVMRNAGALPQR